MPNNSLQIEATHYTLTAITLLMIAVALGAFGAHGLAETVSETRLGTWRTAVDYHMSQSLALFFISLIRPETLSPWFIWSKRLLLSGILIFSGSLYLLVLFDMGVLGAITPIGGVAMILAWLSLLLHFLKHHS